jgi:hypothetical protein
VQGLRLVARWPHSYESFKVSRDAIGAIVQHFSEGELMDSLVIYAGAYGQPHFTVTATAQGLILNGQ